MNVLVKNQRHSTVFLFFLCLHCAVQGKPVDSASTLLFRRGLKHSFFSFLPVDLKLWFSTCGSKNLAEFSKTTYPQEAGNLIDFPKDTIPVPAGFTQKLFSVSKHGVQKQRSAGIAVAVRNTNSFLPATTDNNWQLVESGPVQSQGLRVASDTATPLNGCGAVSLIGAPTSLQINNALHTIDWTYSSGFDLPELYEYTLDGGTLYQPVTEKPLLLGNSDFASGQIGVRVKAGPGNYKSETLYTTIALVVAPENLLPHSNFTFGFPFYLYNCATNPTKKITSPVSDPGTYYQNDLTGSVAEIRLFQFPLKAEQTVTYSMYVKPVNVDIVALNVAVGGTLAEATFKLSTGTVSSLFNANGSVTTVAGYAGWYRVSLTFTSSTTMTDAKLRILFPETTTTNLKSFYLAGAQLNRGLTSTTFVAK